MVNPKHFWTPEEEDVLRAGVAKHGAGKWAKILADQEFGPRLANRSNVDLKDKWRNLQSGNASTSTTRPPQSSPEMEMEYVPMIFKALSSTDLTNGIDVGTIQSYIEQRYDRVLQLSRRYLQMKLRKLLVTQGKIEKMKLHAATCSKQFSAELGLDKTLVFVVKVKQFLRVTMSSNSLYLLKIHKRYKMKEAPQNRETLEDAASYAAYKVAVAEHLSWAAKEACEKADMLEEMVKVNMGMLKLAEELYMKCLTSADGIVVVD